MTIELETENFTLRMLTEADANERYLSWLKDAEVTRTLDVDGDAQTLETIAEYIRSHDGQNSRLFGIFCKDGTFIGTHSFRVWPDDRRAYVGVMIGDKDYWGKAVPLETRGAILDWAFFELGCVKIEASCDVNNYPALYNFKKQGWKTEGVRRRYQSNGDKYLDRVYFGLIDEEWRAIRDA